MCWRERKGFVARRSLLTAFSRRNDTDGLALARRVVERMAVGVGQTAADRRPRDPHEADARIGERCRARYLADRFAVREHRRAGHERRHTAHMPYDAWRVPK